MQSTVAEEKRIVCGFVALAVRGRARVWLQIQLKPLPSVFWGLLRAGLYFPRESTKACS